MNRALNKEIRRFLHFLSPFFLLQPAHKCLEWLIRRYSIEAYDQDDFALLILPYHGTRIFVRCVQIMELSATKWDWLEPVKKSGVPLAKQTLFNRIAGDQALIQAVTKGTVDMVKTLDSKAYSLQTVFAFYCTALLGCLEYAGKVTEAHFTNLLPGLLKGLSSSAVDFTAATLIVLGDLLGRISLAPDTLDMLVMKLLAIPHAALQQEALMLLILLFQSQNNHYKQIPTAALDRLLGSNTFLGTLSELSAAHYRVSPLFVPLLTVCLRRVQEQTSDCGQLREFCESCLSFVVFSDADAKEVVRCVLSSYVLKEAVEDAVITIDSGDDSDIPLSDTNLDVSLWYSGYVRSIERQYPEILSQAMKEILAVDSGILSPQRKSSLKAVLGFLLTNSVQEDGNIDLFEGLFHRQAKCRVAAVRALVGRFEEVQGTSERTRDLIQSTLKERLHDDDSRVVSEVLKLPTAVLIEHVSEEEVLKRAFQLLNKTVTKTNNSWPKVKQRFLGHLLDYSAWTLVTPTELFIQLFPLLMPRVDNVDNVALFEQFVGNAGVQKKWPVVQTIAEKAKKHKEAMAIRRVVEEVLQEKRKAGIVSLAEIIAYCEKSTENKTPIQTYYALKLMHLEKNKIDFPTAQRVLNVLDEFVRNKEVQVDGELVSTDAVPASIILHVLQNLIESLQVKGKFSNVAFSDTPGQQDVLLMRSLFQQIAQHLFEPATAKVTQFSDLLRGFFKKFFNTDKEEISNFLSNYFIGHTMVTAAVSVHAQMMGICIARATWRGTEEEEEIPISDSGMIKIFSGVYHDSTAIKSETLKCLEILSASGPEKWRKFCAALVKNKQSLLMDKEQLPFVIFNHISANVKGRSLHPLVQSFLDVIGHPQTPDYLSATALILIRHVNSAEMVKILANSVAQVFDRCVATSTPLNHHEMMIIEEIVNRLNQSTLLVTAKSPDVWQKCLEKILNNADLLFVAATGGDTDSPFLRLLDVMDDVMFGKLPPEYQVQFIRACLRNCCRPSASQAVFSHAVGKLIKAMPLQGRVAETLLEEMIVNPNVAPREGTSRARRVIEPSTDLLLTDNWRQGVVLLEMVQNKKDIANVQLIVPALFKILKTCIDFDEAHPVDYVKQLVLASLLHCCQQLQEKVNKIDGGLKVDLVVNCIRGSVNPQTHHHALQLICQLAPLAPDTVLQNITDIFTFMGSTIVRQDDAYSFQIILKIIDSVVPILIEKSDGDSGKLVAVLKTFADIILDVPEHRRQAMYVKLLTTLDKQYLWVFVAIVLANHVLKERTKGEKDGDDLPRAIRVALSILCEFEPVVVVETACHLMDYMQKIRLEDEVTSSGGGGGGAEEKKQSTAKRSKAPKVNFEDGLEVAIFDATKSNTKQQRHMKYLLIKFISNALAAPAFVRAVNGRQGEEEEFKRIKPFYQEFIIKDLMCIAALAQINATGQYWKVILHHCYESLNNVIVLLTNQMFFAVVEGLLKHTISTVRKKMLELLVNKCQRLTASGGGQESGGGGEEQNQLTVEDEGALVRLLGPLQQILATIKGGAQGVGGGDGKTSNETLIIQQLALIATKLMGKLLAERYPDEMAQCLRELIDLLEYRKEIPVVVLSANVLCIADLSVNVGAAAIEFLPVFMPIFLEILNTQTHAATVDTILASMLTALQKVVETFAIFLSAYLVDVLVALSLLSVKLTALPARDGKVNATIARIGEMEEKIARNNPLRILVPAVEAAYTRLIVQPKAVDAIGPLMSVLAKSISEVAPQEIYGVQEELAKFFLEALQFRATYAEGKGLSLVELNGIEDRIVDTLISLTLKLSETTFKPLYYKIYDWAIREGAEEEEDEEQQQAERRERVLTFYR